MSAVTPYMFAHVPPGKPSLRAAYEAWLEATSPKPEASAKPLPAHQIKTVGIVGAGMAGLYAGMLLQKNGIKTQIFEADEKRLGGRIYTHRFTNDRNQYFEAGAMRLPNTPEQKPVFDLIKGLNSVLPPEFAINLIPYYLNDPSGNNLVYVNGVRAASGATVTMKQYERDPASLGFPFLTKKDARKTASALLDEPLKPFLDLLSRDFNAGFIKLLQYDNYSLFTYLHEICGWHVPKINYVEVMNSATNQFQNSFTELVIESMDFSNAQWSTIDDGMDRLPKACAHWFKEVAGGTITQGTIVQGIEQLNDGRVALHHSASSSPAVFDAVIVATPPSALRMMETPQWVVTRMQAIRSFHFEPLYKIGMRFRTRFWEQVEVPSRGGQSITDLPSRWCVYPSYGLGDSGPGVLLLYSWMTDAYNWLPQTESERVRIALRDLQALYPKVDITAQFIEAFAVAWPVKWATGDAMFFPGQFWLLFNIARMPEGYVFFAGEHLSVHHTWIVGALDSAALACQMMFPRGEFELPWSTATSLHTYDYGPLVTAAKEALKTGS
jgi:monoamine oxidase